MGIDVVTVGPWHGSEEKAFTRDYLYACSLKTSRVAGVVGYLQDKKVWIGGVLGTDGSAIKGSQHHDEEAAKKFVDKTLNELGLLGVGVEEGWD